MRLATRGWMIRNKWFPGGCRTSQKLARTKIFGVILLLIIICVEFAPLGSLQVNAKSSKHKATPTSLPASAKCTQITFSPDGNPYPVCPGPFPRGGNCVWWAWEQWHLLGYDLPRNWGNATDWAVDAAASGLPLGMTPRLGAIAVFPRGDGVWAYGPEGHVAFVTSVASDGATFNVTYQNYGDPTTIYIGTNYNIDVINQPQFQAGLLRFIYFPRSIDAQLFSQLPGIGNGNLGDALNQANNALASTVNTGASVALGLSPGSSNQEFNADFTGTGSNHLLLYNRQQGTLSVLKLDQKPSPLGKFVSGDVTSNPQQAVRVPAATNVVNLGDSLTPVGTWGSSLDVHIGNFAGTSQSDILLYDRLTGKMQLLSLTPNLTIKQHAIINGLGPDWEPYIGRFNGQKSDVFLYNRYALPQPVSTTNPTSTSNQPRQPTPTPHPVPTVKPTPTPSATSCSTTTASPTATATAASTPCSTVTPTTITCPAATAAAGTPVACSTPTVGATATSTPTPTAGVTATSTPTPTPGVTATSTPTPKPSPSPTPKPSPSPTPTPKPAPTATPTPRAAVCPPVTATVTPHPTPSATPTVCPKVAVTSTLHMGMFGEYSPTANAVSVGGDLSDAPLMTWETQGRMANVRVLDFNQDLSIRDQQIYTLWHGSWEVYAGSFVNANQDGIFLYDRTSGEGRLMDFNDHMAVTDYEQVHNLSGNWVVYNGDFANTGRSQLLLYDPGSGNGQILSFSQNLALNNQKSYTNLGKNLVAYVGRFGTSASDVMLYNSQQGQSLFLSFDSSLQIKQQELVKSWDQNWQVLSGNFQDHSSCSQGTTCPNGNAILVLNRQTGQLAQYAFSFGHQYKIYDNRIQSFVRQGVAANQNLKPVDTTSFNLVNSLSTTIRNEELY